MNLLHYFYKNIGELNPNYGNFYFCSMDLGLDIKNPTKFQSELFSYFIILLLYVIKIIIFNKNFYQNLIVSIIQLIKFIRFEHRKYQ